MAGSNKRIAKDLMTVSAHPVEGVSVSANEVDIRHWDLTVHANTGIFSKSNFKAFLDFPVE